MLRFVVLFFIGVLGFPMGMEAALAMVSTWWLVPFAEGLLVHQEGGHRESLLGRSTDGCVAAPSQVDGANDVTAPAVIGSGDVRRRLTLAGYLEECQANDTRSIKVASWMGRIGNRLQQVHTAVRIAQAAGRRYVQLPGDLDSRVLRLPRRLPVRPDAALPACDFEADGDKYDCTYAFFNRCRSTVAERRRLYGNHVLPYMQKDVLRACKAPGERTVTLHIRNGDVALSYGGQMRHGYHDQPPCLYYHQVINTGYDGGPFSEIQLVHSKEEPKNPCINDIMSRHRDKRILQPTNSVRGDTCLLLKAKSLAVTQSSFSTAMKMVSSKLRRLFFANMLLEDEGRTFDNFDLNTTEVCKAFPHTVGFKVLPLEPRPAASDSYFLRFPAASLVRTACREFR